MTAPTSLESGNPIFELHSPSRCASCKDQITCGASGGRDYFDWSQLVLGVDWCLGAVGAGFFAMGIGLPCVYPIQVDTTYMLVVGGFAAGTALATAALTACACLKIGYLKPWSRQGKEALKSLRNIEWLKDANTTVSNNAKGLAATVAAIGTATDSAKGTVQDLKKALADSDENREVALLREKQAMDTLKAVQMLLDQYREKTREMTKTLNRFNIMGEVFKKNVGEFSGEVEKLEVHKEDLLKKVDEFDDVKDFVGEQTALLNKMYESFQTDYAMVQKSVQGLSDELKEFRQNTHKIDAEGEELKQTVADLKRVEEEIGDTVAKALEEMKKLKGGGSK